MFYYQHAQQEFIYNHTFELNIHLKKISFAIYYRAL